jgi:NAD(P)-dependent dehydrogenase (short-subunit alcohol dehydrogenase family)
MTANKTTRVALVTGGGSGMGQATSLRFARDGMAVGVLDINEDAAAAVAAQIRQAGGRALALQADVSDKAQVAAAVARLREELGPVAVLVNNAAIEEFCPFSEITEGSWDRHLAVNLKSLYIVTQAVLPDMEAAGWGRIINISGFGAQLSAPNMAHYFASKGGVISLTRGLAAEMGAKGITVNSVSPGFIDTPMSRRAIAGGKFPVAPEVIYGAYPIPRMGRPEEIAAACAFLASDDAGYITAQTLGVNGGASV